MPSISNKFKYKTSTKLSQKNPSATLLHYIENILNHLSGKCHDSDSESHQVNWPLYNIYFLMSP